MNAAAALPFIGTLVLAGCAGGLSYLVFTSEPLNTQQFDIETPRASTDASVQPSRRPSLPSARPDVYYQAITQRPIFEPKRRPITVAPASEPIADTVLDLQPDIAILIPENMTLSGVLGGRNNRSAFVAWANSQGEWVKIDDAIEGWVVTGIESEWITLTAGEKSFRLELFE